MQDHVDWVVELRHAWGDSVTIPGGAGPNLLLPSHAYLIERLAESVPGLRRVLGPHPTLAGFGGKLRATHYTYEMRTDPAAGAEELIAGIKAAMELRSLPSGSRGERSPQSPNPKRAPPTDAG